MTVPERNIQIELYRILQNVIKEKFSFNDIEFVNVRFEPTIDGRPDLVIEAHEKGKPISLMVIETKRKVPYIDRKFDPFSKDVIKQAAGYAVDLGAPYFATCNGEILVIFDTFTAGVPLPQRRLKRYKVFFDENFARMLLKELGRFRIGVGKWLPLDDVFVERLRSFHRFITPFMFRSLVEKLRDDEKFKEEYVRWLKSQLFEYSDRMNENIAEQMAYLLINKISFYKTLETQIPELIKLKKIDAVDGKEFSEKLQGRFKEVISKADYEGIFQTTILDRVPLSNKLVYHLNEFIEEMGAYNLAKIRSDVLGRVYEDLIPADERHRLGQYYTPPPIVELIVEMCVKSPNDKVLDPGCGSGSFLVKAYHKLRDLKKKENPFRTDEDLHKELLDQVYGIDINPFPAQLSSINLAIRNLKVRSEHINLFPSDFFKVKPAMPPLPKEFDVVVTNPPYTRQEELEYKEKIRQVALTYTDGSEIDIDSRASIYAYFFTHSAKFLKNGGRMGYITSNTWLDVGFGKGLKQFFLDHFKLNAIIEFDAAVFGRALVNTCVSILEKKQDQEERSKNVVKFVRLKKPIDINKVVNTIWTINKEYEDDQIRIVLRNQSELKPEERWGKLIRAPAIYFKIVNNPRMIKLSVLAKIKRGFVTGFNNFFILDEDETKSWGIEEEYLEPIVTSIREIDKIDLTLKEITQQVLMVHEPKGVLKGKKVLRYIEHGEEMEVTTKRGTRIATSIVKGIHNLRTCKQRKIWYDLGIHKPPPIISPYLIWARTIFAHNKARALAPNTLHFIYPNKKEYILFLLGVLNSTLTAFLLELTGRSYGGGVLKIEAYELKELPIIDPAKTDSKSKKRIENALSKLCDAQRKGDKREEENARKEIDNTVFDILRLTKSEIKQVRDGLESLRQMRLKRKEVGILVETGEKWKPQKKPQKKRKIVEEKPTKRLDTWIK